MTLRVRSITAERCRVVCNRMGDIGFAFDRELTAEEAAQFFEDVGVWPMHTVDGELRATNPKKAKP